MAINCNSESLLDSSRCIRSCIHPGLYPSIETWLLAKYAGQTTDATTLAQNAACLRTCLSAHQLLAIEVWLWAVLAGVNPDAQALLAGAECYEPCLLQGQMPGVLWLESLLAITSAVPENLTGQNACLRGCLSDSQFSSINVWLLATKAGQTTDPQTLASSAVCLSGCLSARQLQAIKLYLLCVLAGGMSSLYLGLIAYWKMDEGPPTGVSLNVPRVDSYGSFNLLAQASDGVNYPLQNVGKLTRCVQNATNIGWLQLDDSPSLRLKGSFSIQAWWRQVALTPGFEGSLIQKGLSPDIEWRWAEYRVDATTAARRIYLKINGQLILFQGTPTAITGIFRHAVIVYDAAQGVLKIHQNAVADVFANVFNVDTGNVFSPLYVLYPDNPAANLQYRVDELAIWNRALADSEVAALFNANTGKSFPFTP